ncbi:BTAD domain-containing putative transcriptional regulator [Nocardioides aequoreus]|uniref:BTAD domain-containing putative transcriptional regulator n=1 Tax=Nocardioides aequoreus TaxID=397278 RepID=UPI000A9A9D33|nr:BTAD domain-containing putative transcriptional regulator [Nocardioides aequoreus]
MAPTVAPLAFGLLGPLQVRRAGTALDLGAPKQRLVLARLLLSHGRVVHADALLDAVWGDDPPASALPSLQVYVSNLRRVLRDGSTAPSPLVRQAPGYLLDTTGHEVDADLFLADVAAAQAAQRDERWSEAAGAATDALARWRGPVVADLGEPLWAAPEAHAWEERRALAHRVQVTGLLGAGDVEDAVASALELRQTRPHDDEAARLLALALHRAGRTADALEQLRRHLDRLDADLGLEPSAQLRDLQTSLLRADPGPPPQGGVVPAGPGPAPEATTPATLGDDTFVGRESQLGVAREALTRVAGGAPAWLVLTGPAGIGKTRLAERVLALASATGADVVRAGCPEDSGAPAGWPLRQVVAGLGADPDEVLRVPEGADADTARYDVLDRVGALLAAHARRRGPLVLLVDDVQWADDGTLQCLTHLAATLADGVLVVLTVRDVDDASEPVTRAVAEVLRRGHARHLVVPPLSERDVDRLCTVVSGEALPSEEVRDLAERTGGNALFVTEYARLSPAERLEGGTPLLVRSVLGRRLAVLDAGVLQVLRAAAVVGDDLDLDLLARVTRVDPEELVDLLDDAVDERIVVLRPDGTGYRFAHALLRDELLAGLSPLRRQRLHLRVAETVREGSGAAGSALEESALRAHHLAAARPLGDPRDLLAAARVAATGAEGQWAWESAAHWWDLARQAHDTLPTAERDPDERDELLVARMQALVRAGQQQTMLRTVEQELLDAVRAGRSSTVGRLAGSLVRSAGTWPWVAYDLVGGLPDRLAALEPAVVGDHAAHARLLGALAAGRCYDLDPEVPRDLARRALALAERVDDPQVLADVVVGCASAIVGVAGRAEECEALLDRLDGLEHDSADVDRVIAAGSRQMTRFLLGDVAGTEEQLHQGVLACDLLRLPLLRVQMRWCAAGLAMWSEGPHGRVEQLVAEAGEAHRRPELYVPGFAELARTILLWQQGRLLEQPLLTHLEPTTWRAVRAAAAGDVAEADRLVAARLAEPRRLVWITLGHLVALAHAVADAGLTHHVPELLERLAPFSGTLSIIGQGGVTGPVDLPLARLHRLLGDSAAAERLADAARELCLRNGGTTWAVLCEQLRGPSTPG